MKADSKARADELHRVTPALCVWQAYDPACKADVTSAAHLIEGRLVLVDPIELAQPAETELFAWGDPLAIILTNGNHERAGARFAERWQLPILCHEEAAVEVSLPVDSCLVDGEELFGGLNVVTLPGGGPGELALYHPRTKTLSFGDLVINLPRHGFSLLPDKYCRDPRQARVSLQKLRGLAVNQITFAHGLPIITDAGDRLTGLLHLAR